MNLLLNIPIIIGIIIIFFNNFKLISAVGFDISLLEPQCDSEIYCYGELLHVVQNGKLYSDSKTFVDRKLKESPSETLTKFTEWYNSHNRNPTEQQLREFVNDTFDDLGLEFEPWTPEDWKDTPEMLNGIKDAALRQWAKELNEIWHRLGKKMKAEVYRNPELYSIIPVPNPVIVPGGRFLEFYYWDSYWIIRGLLNSEMFDTAKGMLQNFLYIVDHIGHIPNGGRIYYKARSQPPLLIPMMKSFHEFTNDDAFIRESIQTMENEFQYWMDNHITQVNGYNVAVYGDRSSGPRPESYDKDYDIAQQLETDEEKEELYAELKAAAESGMDFSSRWFIKDGTNIGLLIDTKCRYIVPVELNAFLYWNAMILSEFYSTILENPTKATEFSNKATEIKNAIDAVLWNAEKGVWLDYDILNSKPRDYWVPTNLSPLWTKCYDETQAATLSTGIIKYIKDTKIEYPGGIPNTLNNTGEQWDFPNVWPPMQHMLIMGLDNLNTEESKELAYSWAELWVQSNFQAYKRYEHMFEKYDALAFGGRGGGGEYDVQLGFGWSNGVILDLLHKYGDRLTGKGNSLKGLSISGIITTLIAVLATTTSRIFA